MTYQPDRYRSRSRSRKIQHEADPYEILGPGDSDQEDEEQRLYFADEPLTGSPSPGCG